MSNNGFGIYIHVPFCKSKCTYCDFYSVTEPSLYTEYANTVINEWQTRKSECQGPIRTLYLGGGTPSVLDDAQLERIICAVKGDSHPVEVTMEVNPDDVTTERVYRWLAAGVNRISMGVQTLDDQCLRSIARRHSAQGALKAYDILRNCGVDNVSLDLIYGLPGQTLQSWSDTFETILALRPEHLSAYLLSYEEGTPITRALDAGTIAEASDELIAEMYDRLCDSTRAAGYEHYEISNFCLPGRQAVHNSAYWDGTPYIGLGPGAHSWDGNARRVNPSDVKAYISDYYKTQIEIENFSERINDQIFTALRTSKGLDLDDLPDHVASQIRRAVSAMPAGWVEQTGSRIYIPENKFLVSDAIIRELLL